MRRVWYLGAGLVAATAATASCREPAGGEPEPLLIQCFQALAVTVDVQASPAPRIAWSPRCGATYLEVATIDRRDVVWVVQGDTGRMAPGVTYGAPPGAFESRLGPAALVRGLTYVARVGVQIDEDSFGILGEGTFVP